MCRGGTLGFSFLFRGSRRFSRTCGFTIRARSILVVISDNGSFFDFPTFRKGRKRDNIWMVLYKAKRDVNKGVMQRMSNKNRESTKVTLGSALAALYGFTRQEDGTGSFLLREEIFRTSFSKSLTGKSTDRRSTSLSPAYFQRGFLRACRGCTLILRKYAVIWIPDSSLPRVFWSSWMRVISASVDVFSSSVASASQERRR